jgi:hypothetical protein
MWRGEQAAKLSGYISAGVKHSGNRAHFVQFGTTGGKLDLRYEGGPQFQVLYDAGIRIDTGEYGPEISTTIRDRSGRVVVTVIRNHWTVAAPPICYDKNYSSNSLEVEDNRGHVVLQITLLPDLVQLQGEWRDEFGNGWRLADGQIQMWRTAEVENRLKRVISPVFKYPSSEHWGELVASSSN